MAFELLNIPSNVGGATWILVQTIVIFAVIVISDHIIAHGVGVKHALIMSFVAYFLAPLILVGASLGGFSLPFIQFIIPLIVWVILGEILLEGDMKDKAIVGVLAYVTYLVLSLSGLQATIISMVPF